MHWWSSNPKLSSWLEKLLGVRVSAPTPEVLSMPSHCLFQPKSDLFDVESSFFQTENRPPTEASDTPSSSTTATG